MIRWLGRKRRANCKTEGRDCIYVHIQVAIEQILVVDVCTWWGMPRMEGSRHMSNWVGKRYGRMGLGNVRCATHGGSATYVISCVVGGTCSAPQSLPQVTSLHHPTHINVSSSPTQLLFSHLTLTQLLNFVPQVPHSHAPQTTLLPISTTLHPHSTPWLPPST